jgi:tight adherence protein B
MLGVIFAVLAVLTGFWGIGMYRWHGRRRQQLLASIHSLLAVRSPAGSWLDRLTQRIDQSSWGRRTASKLSASGLRITPAEYGVLLLAAFVVAFWGLRSWFHPGFAYELGLAAGLVATGRTQIFRRLQKRTGQLLQQQLPEICRLLGNSLRAGFTLSQGIEFLSRELPNPAKQEFQTMHKELLLGVELENVLRSLQQRIRTRDIELFAASLLIQHKTGGNLAGLLDDMARTLEERLLLLRSFHAMTAEGRYVAAILPVLPAVSLVMLSRMVDHFLDPLFTIPGFLLLGGFGVVQMVAYGLIRNIIRIRV